jgi:hypothetical protein
MDDYVRAMCGRDIQSSGPLLYAIVDGMIAAKQDGHIRRSEWLAAARAPREAASRLRRRAA